MFFPVMIVIMVCIILGAAIGHFGTKEYPVKYDVLCIEGVGYIQTSEGLTVKYNQDGSIAICK